MRDLEDRLRDELGRKAQEFDPSPDLSERVAARIDRRSRQHRFLAVAATILVVGAVLGGALSLLPGPDSGGRVDMSDPARQTTPTTEREPEPTTSTAPEQTTTTLPQRTSPEVSLTPSTSSTTTTTAPTPAIGPDTPLSWWGVGPIRAGMTIREAEEAAGVAITVHQGTWDFTGGRCATYWIEGDEDMSPSFVAWTPNYEPSDDPKDAVVRATAGGGMVTEEGVRVGSTIEDVHAVYGQPTSTAPDSPGSPADAQILIYEQDGYSYGFQVWSGQVQDIRSGHITGLAEFDPCD
jgi:hypothetical protein